MDDYCCFGDIRRDVARQEAKENGQEKYLYQCLRCGYEVTIYRSEHYCPMCSTLYERVPLARIVEQ